jgi:hypothetical protein
MCLDCRPSVVPIVNLGGKYGIDFVKSHAVEWPSSLTELVQKFTYDMAARFNRPWRETSFVKHEIGELNHHVFIRCRGLDGVLDASHKSEPPNCIANEPLSRFLRV